MKNVPVVTAAFGIVLAGALGVPARAADILIHSGRVDFCPAEYFLDGRLELRVLNSPPSAVYFYESSDGGRCWWSPGGGTWPDTTLNVFSFVSGGDFPCYYVLFDWRGWVPNSLGLEMHFQDSVYHLYMGVAPEDINAHDFAGCTDHLGGDHWIYLCVVDTDPPLPGKALMFLRSTDYGEDGFPAVDSYPLAVREPYLACGAGTNVYFAGRAGARGDSLIVWTNSYRLEPSCWRYDWIPTGGDEIECPVIAASFDTEDSLATVWCAYSRNRDNSGNWDIEYAYSTDGGVSWSGPRVLAGSPTASERYFDLKSWRNPGAREVSVAYVGSVGPDNFIYRRFADAGQPTAWSEPVRMNSCNAALGKRVRPRLCYLAGQPSVGPGVVYVGADSGGCWWSAPYPGVEEEPARAAGRLHVAPRIGAGPFRIGGTTAGDVVTIHDLTGRAVREIAAAGSSVVWDGRDERGTALPAGVCFVRLRDSGSQARLVLTR